MDEARKEQVSHKPSRNPDGTFVKGESGNPNGRPVGSKNHYNQEIRDFLKRNFIDSIPQTTLDAIRNDPKLLIQVLAEVSKSMTKEEQQDLGTQDQLTIRIQDETRDDQKP